MRKIFNKFYIVLVTLFCMSFTACHSYSKDYQVEPQIGLQGQLLKQYHEALQVAEEKTIPIERKNSENSIEEVTDLYCKLPTNAFIIEFTQYSDGTQEVLTLKEDGLLQLWENENIVCETKIPIPSKLMVGNNFYEIIGNPYISKDGELVLIQSFTTSDGKQLDYTILTNNCKKIIPSLNYNGYVFQNFEGKYGLVFCSDDSSFLSYPYEGFGFNPIADHCIFPKPTIIWLNESTVKNVNFESWVSISYNCQAITGISVSLDVESYGELDIAHVGDSFEPIEIDDEFNDLLYEKFSPEEYEERFLKVIQTLNEYKQKS